MKKWVDLAAAVMFGAALLFGLGTASSGEAAPAPKAHHEIELAQKGHHHGGPRHIRYERHHPRHHARHHHPRRDIHPISHHKHHHHRSNSNTNLTAARNL